MSVGRICTRVVASAAPRENVRDAARRMREFNVGTLVVQGEDGGPIGVLTDRDVVMRVVAKSLDPSAALVKDAMTAPALSVHENSSIEEALERMGHSAARRMVVVDDAGRAVGVLSLDDVLEVFMGESAAIGRIIHKEAPTLSPKDDGRRR